MMREPVVVNGVTRWLEAGEGVQKSQEEKEQAMPILREQIGDVLRDVRQRQGRTLRDVSHDARVSLGYLSEVERGQKEASSELLAAICAALDIPLALMLREVSDRIAAEEAIYIPDTVPAELAHRYAQQANARLRSTGEHGHMAGSH